MQKQDFVSLLLTSAQQVGDSGPWGWRVSRVRVRAAAAAAAAEMALHPQAKLFCHCMSSDERTDAARCMVVVVITLPLGIADDVE